MNELPSIFADPEKNTSEYGERHSQHLKPQIAEEEQIAIHRSHEFPAPNVEIVPYPIVSPATSIATQALSDSSWVSSHRSQLQSIEGAPASFSKKRASSKSSVSSQLSPSAGPPPPKRPHHRQRSPRKHPTTSLNRRTTVEQQPRGPLLLSEHPQQRPALPYRPSSSDARAQIMSKSNKDDNGEEKLLKLAKGSARVSNSSRPTNQRTPSGSGKSHFGLVSKGRSPGSAEKQKSIHVLTQSGIVELLEQDERPTFILDLSEQTSSEPGSLKIAFANTSLRALPEVFGSVSGPVHQALSSQALGTPFSDFKSWCTSYVKDFEPQDVVLPSFSFAGVTWTSSNLQKRFRVFKGQCMTPNANNLSFDPMSLSETSVSPAGRHNNDPDEGHSIRAHATEEYPQDYFGPAGHVDTPKIESTGDSKGAGEVPHGLRIPRATPPSDTIKLSSPDPMLMQASMADDNIQKASVQRHQYTSGAKYNQGFFDWTRLADSPILPRHIRFAQSIDWASTSLGPIDEWPTELRSMCNFIMASPHPAAMYWGPDYIAIYNEAYIYLAGHKHPRLMGQSYREAWAEIWDSVKDVFDRASNAGESTLKEDDCLFIQRATTVANVEETWFDWSIIPLVGGDGSVVGLYNPAFEKTKRKVGERRLETLSRIGEKTSTAKDVKTFWKQIISGLEANPYDAPFALLYSVNDEISGDSQSSLAAGHLQPTTSCNLEGSIGVPNGHPVATPQIDFQRGNGYLARVFREAGNRDRPLLLSVSDGTLDSEFLRGLEMRGHPQPCTSAICCPVQSTRSETLGYLLIGINPRRPFDEEYSTFIQMLSRQISTAVASVVLFEEELRAGMKAQRRADMARIELSEQLAVQKQVAADTERKFTQMAKFAPVGIFMADANGEINYRNDKWYEMMRLPIVDSSKNPNVPSQWSEAIHDEDNERVERLWYELVHNGVPMCTELRIKASWVDQEGHKADTWVLASGFPDKDEDGNVKRIYGSITDISHQKWVEFKEKKRMEAAVELKRQQENFVDIVSHELRNPIAAMFLCSEDIINGLSQMQGERLDQVFKIETRQVVVNDIIQSTIESAKTITQCAQHQKRIVDDILTVSKMDSALLLVTPCPEQPEMVVRRALKMFEREVKTADIQMDFRIDESIRKLHIDWVQLDRSRLAQVLINLVTNAIKFTTKQQTRRITITLSFSLERPSRDGRIAYFPPRTHKPDLTENSEWGHGEQLYMHVAVEDTGRGLNDDEKKLLFLRFSQASPRTHVQYGGSGLGLFISRELVELQGGEIGVASQSKKGSTFAFFIKIRRASKPQDDADQLPISSIRKPLQPAGSTPLGSADSSFQDSSTNPKTSLTGSTVAATTPSTPLSILIVEDNPINQTVLARALQKLGVHVHLANDGVECLDRIKTSTHWRANKDGVSLDGSKAIEIDVILMDQEMPVMDGLTCTKIIRAMERKGELIGHMPIIAVTGNARAGQVETAREVGMDEIVSKPFRVADLMPFIEELKARYPAPIVN